MVEVDIIYPAINFPNLCVKNFNAVKELFVLASDQAVFFKYFFKKFNDFVIIHDYKFKLEMPVK